MTLRKITIDKSVRFVPKSKQTKEKEIKQKTIKAGSLPRKQNKKTSQNNKKFLKKFQHQDLNILQNSNYRSIRIIIFLFIYE